jgi:hypothetical protein
MVYRKKFGIKEKKIIYKYQKPFVILQINHLQVMHLPVEHLLPLLMITE